MGEILVLTVESSTTYEDLRNDFFHWLEKQRDVTLPTICDNAITSWIKDTLDPLDSLWLNYHQLYNSGMDQRCTSIVEALHWSMKSGHDGVRAGMSVPVSANTQMDKAQREGVQLAQMNAEQLQKKAYGRLQRHTNT